MKGLRWHKLTALSVGDHETEVMGATCIDGIGVIARWIKWDAGWSVDAIDTEGTQWNAVDFEDDANEIPGEPPTAWDDLPRKSTKETPEPPAETATDEVLAFLQELLTEAEKTLKAREASAASWRTGTEAEWKEAARLSKMKPFTQAQRIREADIQERIAVKSAHRVAMLKLAIACHAPTPPTVEALAATLEAASNHWRKAQGYTGSPVHRAGYWEALTAHVITNPPKP